MRGPYRYDRLRRTALLLALVILLPVIGRAVDLTLGPFTFAYPPAMALNNPTHLSEGLNSYMFCSKVGGIAFGGVAVGEDSMKAVALKYDDTQPDGQRLKVTLADTADQRQTVTAPIYDWQLIPIARYAAGNQDACFTLFGELLDSSETTARRTRNEEILNYHPAFANTLLGLRLFQADVLILYPQSCDLPKNNDAYLLGAGETVPDVEANQKRLSRVDTLLDHLDGGPFQSYVIGDNGVQVTFTATDGKLVLTGDPVWHCWKSTTRDPDRLHEIERDANQQANAEGNRQLKEAFQHDAAVLSPEDLKAKYTDAYQKQFFKRVFDKAFDRIVSEALLERMPAYSQSLSDEIRRQDGINTDVYAALTTTMRYTAFFRHVKKVDPAGYKDFMASLAQVAPEPIVRTPTVLVPSR